jgi:hypothetical protein
MSYVIWRMHRNQIYFAGAVLAGLAVLLGITGAVMSHDYHAALAGCGATQSCSDLSSTLFQGDGFIIDLVGLTIVAPALLGLFWGTPLVAKELEDGTNVLAWTQAITRRVWMARNVTWALVAAAIWGGAMSLIVSWWRIPENALYGRFDAFDIQGVAPIAYSIFAVALGIALGTWCKRLLPALASTLVVLFTARIAIGIYLRPRFMAPVRGLFSLVNDNSGAPANVWLISKEVANPAGHVVDTNNLTFFPAACSDSHYKDPISCLSHLGYHRLVTYQPDSRFWTFQAIESAIFVVLAAVLVALAFRTVLRRDA